MKAFSTVEADDETITDASEEQPTSETNPNRTSKKKKKLWIALGFVAIVVVVALLMRPRVIYSEPKDTFQEINQWLSESELMYNTYRIEVSLDDYSDRIAHLNRGYDCCLLAADAIRQIETADSLELLRMNDSLGMLSRLRVACDSLNSLYVNNISFFIGKELEQLSPDQDTTAIMSRLRQLEEFSYVKNDIGGNEMLNRIKCLVEIYTKDENVIMVNGVSFVMKRVQGGSFLMGSEYAATHYHYADEAPEHDVTVSTFYMGETEVTQALWKVVMGSNPSNFKGDNLPVEKVSWNDCQEFIGKLNSLTGLSFRLPTEAEWEYAARGGNRSKGTKYAGNSQIGSVAWYFSINDHVHKTHEVKGKLPNELGLYDMSGNVQEWCQDWWGFYSSSPSNNPTGPSSGTCRVLRGGDWNTGTGGCRVSYRVAGDPDARGSVNGFRLCLPQ